MLRFGETKLAKEKCYAAKQPVNNWDDNIDNIVIWKLVKTKTNSKHLIGYLERFIRPLLLILPRISGCVRRFKVKDGGKKSNKLISFPIDD